jgi:hypothetical protein
VVQFESFLHLAALLGDLLFDAIYFVVDVEPVDVLLVEL